MEKVLSNDRICSGHYVSGIPIIKLVCRTKYDNVTGPHWGEDL